MVIKKLVTLVGILQLQATGRTKHVVKSDEILNFHLRHIRIYIEERLFIETNYKYTTSGQGDRSICIGDEKMKDSLS